MIDANKIIDKESLQFNQFSFRKREDREVDHRQERDTLSPVRWILAEQTTTLFHLNAACTKQWEGSYPILIPKPETFLSLS